jgi:hypothetical protein
MKKRTPEYGLEFLLAFDGRIHHLEEGYWIKFEIERVKATKERPHGLSYSFTLRGPDGTRLVGFDNSHGVPALGARFKRKPRRAIIGTERGPIQGDRTSSRMLRH